MPSPTSDRRGRVLLAIAADTVAEALGLGQGQIWDEPWLFEPGATFVTLATREGQLRGCVGTTRAHRSLIEDVRSNARGAAFDDPRFPPVTLWEFGALEFEVSLLSALQALAVRDEADLLRQIRPGVDGLILAWRDRQGTFLPQVWKSLPRPDQFLRQLKLKAGFAEDFWSPEVRVWRYTVQKWHQTPFAPA